MKRKEKQVRNSKKVYVGICQPLGLQQSICHVNPSTLIILSIHSKIITLWICFTFRLRLLFINRSPLMRIFMKKIRISKIMPKAILAIFQQIRVKIRQKSQIIVTGRPKYTKIKPIASYLLEEFLGQKGKGDLERKRKIKGGKRKVKLEKYDPLKEIIKR